MNTHNVLLSDEWTAFEQLVAENEGKQGGIARLSGLEKEQITGMPPDERVAFMAVYGALRILMTTRNHQNLFARAPGLFAPLLTRGNQAMRIAPDRDKRAAEILERVIVHADRHVHNAEAYLNLTREVGQITIDHVFKPADTMGLEPESFILANDDTRIVMEAKTTINIDSDSAANAHRVTGIVPEFAVTLVE